MGKLLSLKTAPAARAAVIDEFGDAAQLRREFLATTGKRYDQLCAEIKTWHADAPGDRAFAEKGLRYQLDISMQANVTAIDVRASYKKLGLARFLKAVTLTLKALRELLPEPDIDALTSSARTGSRTITATAIAAPAIEASAVQPIDGFAA